MTVKRLALLAAAGVLWLFVAALPTFADGGPHVMAVNDGTGTGGNPALSGDCASCHRAHTAKAADLLTAAVPGLCTNCHNGTKATTDVIDGVQYNPTGTAGTYDHTTGNILGALRGGGFDYALIDSGNAARYAYSFGGTTRFTGHVGVLDTPQVTTSTHGGTGTAWGNGDVNTGAGASVVLDCAKCHNPHGNGQYRILNTTPGESWSAPFEPANAGGVQVAEVTPVTLASGEVRNYTVRPSTDGLTTGVAGTTYQGDYWRLKYDPTGATTWLSTINGMDPMNRGWDGVRAVNAAQNGGSQPANTNGLMTAWCIQCHTRYSGLPSVADLGAGPDIYPSSIVAMEPQDAIFTYKHGTTNVGCEQCHVSHGSNAVLSANGSMSLEAPDLTIPATVPGAGTGATTSADSRLLKIDNLGTCSMCHDPTNTVTTPSYVGPDPTPGL
jgi:predicted CXXCH cytochrome family protein